jgi:hypothetical protein
MVFDRLITNLSKKGLFFWLQLATISVLFGRAYQHLFFIAPYSELFWDENMLAPLLELVQVEWSAYLSWDLMFYYQHLCGIILTLGVVVACLPEVYRKRFRGVFLLNALILTILAIALFKGNFFRIGQLIEYSAQFGCVYLFYFWHRDNAFKRVSIYDIIRVLVALTFIGHGLYAIGFYNAPYNFSQMVWETFPFFTEKMTASFLMVFGVLDLIAVVLLFVKSRPVLYRGALAYCIIWGALTAFARIVSTFYIEMPLMSLHDGIYEVIYRFPHFLLPLILLLFDQKEKRS